MILLLACVESKTEPAPPELVPREGIYAVEFAQTYEGTCRLGDMDTRQPEASEWEISLESVGFTLIDETGYPSWCSYTAPDFSCSEGTYHVSYVESGYDAVEFISTVTAGTFSDEVTFEASLAITAECDGADCPEVGRWYGNNFTYPCTAVAPFTGAWSEE